MKFLVCMILVFSLILIGTSLKSSFSYTEGFEESQSVFTDTPLVCTVEFEDENFPQIKKMMDVTENAILEWKERLQGTEQSLKSQSFWDIKYTLVTLDKKDTFDFSKCDVVIKFQDKPNTLDLPETECVKYDDGSTICKTPIIYDHDISCDYLGITKVTSPVQISIYLRNTCNDGIQLNDDILGSTILHEFGHALGLGHYVSDDESINEKWANAELEMPSIMVKFASDVAKYEEIRSIDVEKVLSMYGKNGFLSDKIPLWIRNNCYWWSLSQISDQDFALGMEYLIKEGMLIVPEGTISKEPVEPQIPSLKKIAGDWSQRWVPDATFLKSVQWMIDNGFIKI